MKEDEVSGVCSTQENVRNAFSLFVGKPEGRGQMGDRRRCEDNS
jgi:hypothetical protein